MKTGDYSLAKERKYKISHIAECISQIISFGNCQNNCCVYISIYHKNAFVFVKRISDPIFSNVFKFSTAEDFLYHIQSVFEALNLNNSNDKIFVLGSIDTESQIVRLLKIYFLNVAVEHNFNFSGNILYENNRWIFKRQNILSTCWKVANTSNYRYRPRRPF
ncbi:MAG: DUF3822 family protein [Saprospiraceae bacterium]|nr:DUF3822 family protein [Saprospiraceae bacterium]